MKPAWEKEFDAESFKERGMFDGGDPYGLRTDALKSFIRTKIEEAYQRGRSEDSEKSYEIGYKEGYRECYEYYWGKESEEKISKSN